jgi:hypothetical protein
MNSDGEKDFAVLLVDTRKPADPREMGRFALAVFNRPFKPGQNPAYFEEGLYDIASCYLVFDKTRRKHLYLGKFESGAYCATYYAEGSTYIYKDCWDK